VTDGKVSGSGTPRNLAGTGDRWCGLVWDPRNLAGDGVTDGEYLGSVRDPRNLAGDGVTDGRFGTPRNLAGDGVTDVQNKLDARRCGEAGGQMIWRLPPNE
jgi:hypothetical protein